MQRGLISLTKPESLELSRLSQKFTNQSQETANYELSAEDVNWLLDQLPIPQESNEAQKSVREKLRAFLAQA